MGETVDSLNQILLGDCVEVMMAEISDESVDTIFFSPPYDAMRLYGSGKGPPEFDITALAKECHRVLKDGGIAGIVIGDGTKNHAKSLTTFRTAIDWCDNTDFRLWESLIYHRKGAPGGWWRYRFRVDHEFILVFLKGDRPAHFAKEELKVPSIHAGKKKMGGKRLTDGSVTHYESVVNPTKCRGTVWTYPATEGNRGLRKNHPATMPISLARDFLHVFTPQGGLVLDPMAGSGTTLVAAAQQGLSWIGIEINPDYHGLIQLRLDAEGTDDPCIGEVCVPPVYSRGTPLPEPLSDPEQASLEVWTPSEEAV